jgi:hypothetical protein
MDAIVGLSLGAAWVGVFLGGLSLYIQRKDKAEALERQEGAAAREFTVAARLSGSGEPGLLTVVVRNKGARRLSFGSKGVAVTVGASRVAGSPVATDYDDAKTSPEIPIGGRWDFSVSELEVAEIVQAISMQDSGGNQGVGGDYLMKRLHVRVEATDDDTTEVSEWVLVPPPSQQTQDELTHHG